MLAEEKQNNKEMQQFMCYFYICLIKPEEMYGIHNKKPTFASHQISPNGYNKKQMNVKLRKKEVPMKNKPRSFILIFYHFILVQQGRHFFEILKVS